MGTLIKTAKATMMSVPTSALPNPPPCSSGAGGRWVKTVRLSFRPPRQASIKTTENNGISANRVMEVTTPFSRKSISVRGRRRERSSSEKFTPAKGPVKSGFTEVSVLAALMRTLLHSSKRCAPDHDCADDVNHQSDAQ